MRISLRTLTVGLTVATALAVAGCSSPAESAGSSATPSSGGDASSAPASATAAAPAEAEWPQTIEHAAGTTEIPAEPVRVVSTSPSLTGSLLAIDAPVVASAAAPVTALTDDKGFFAQWADAADQRGVEVLYSNLELDLDAIETFAPDLIIGSASGGDSTLDGYDQLSEIAPTVLVDYGSTEWQELTVELAEVVGLEQNAADVVAEYESWVGEQAGLIELPEQPVMALVYLGADGVWVYSSSTPQADLLTSLGFDYADVPESAAGSTQSGSGVTVVAAESMPAALAEVQTLFVVPISSDAEVSAFASDALVANAPAVTSERVFSLGSPSFRLDYYSAKDTVELLVSEFGH